MTKAVVYVGVMLAVAFRAHAGDIETLLLGPGAPATAGKSTELTVIWTNSTERSHEIQIAESLTCRVDSDVDELTLIATAIAPEPGPAGTLLPHGFIKRRYRLPVPDALSGWVTLECALEGVHRLSFRVDTAGGDPPTVTDAPVSSEDDEEQQVLETLQSRFQMYADKLSFYEPMYFLVGIDPEESKFQISFKYRFFNTDAFLVQNHPWIEGFHLAYTQTSFWDLKSESAPFRDTSYKPELFFLSPTLEVKIPRLYLFKFQSGFQHESNGRGGEESRSTNFLYAKPILIFGQGSPHAFEISPKFWIYVGNDDQTNPDLSDYRGYFDLELKFARARSFALTTHYTYARKGSSFQVDFTFPLSRLLAGNLDLYFQAQYFNGYGESLLRFMEKTEALRLGIAIVR